MFPNSSNVYNPFPNIINSNHHSNITPESNFSMTCTSDHGNAINFHTLIDHHQHEYDDYDDGLLLSHLLSQQQLLLSPQPDHQIEEDHSFNISKDQLEADANTKGFSMMMKKKTSKSEGQSRRKRTGKKDRHSKICTAQGPRDRRMRLSLQIARKFFDLQDMLGFDKASKTIEWLFLKSKSAIKELKENVVPPTPQGKQNCQSSSTTSEISEVLSARTIEIIDAADDREENGKEKKKRKKLCYKVGKESREKARERARERTREKMKIRSENGGIERSKEMNHRHYDNSLKMVCEAHHDQDQPVNIDELAAVGDDDKVHVMNYPNCCVQGDLMRGSSRSRSSSSVICDYLQEIGVTSSGGANSEEDFLGNFPGNWDTSNAKTQSFSCTITNAKRFTAAAAAAAAAGGNQLCCPIYSTNFSDIQEEKPSNNYSIVFPNPCSIFVNQSDHHIQTQEQNPNFDNTSPIFLTGLIAQDQQQNHPSSNLLTNSNILWQSQILENQYFSCNPIISNKNHISY